MKLFIAIVGVGLLASLAFNIFQQQEISSLSSELHKKSAEANEEAKADADRAHAEAEAARKKAEDLVARVEELQGEVTTLKEEAKEEKEEAKDSNPMAAIGEMFENEDMRKMIKAQMEGQVDMMFGDLYDEFELEGEDLELFKELLVEQQMTIAQLGMRMMKAKDDPEASKALQTQIADYQEQYKEKIREFLNDDGDFETYEFHTKTQSERMELNAFEDSAEKAGHPLSAEQKDSLVRMMFEERKAFKFDSNFEESDPEFEYNKLDSENVNRHLEQMGEVQAIISERSGEILSPEQVPLFQKNQESFLQMIEMQMKMAATMMGGKSE